MPMQPAAFDDKELALITELSAGATVTQRELSRNVGLSLGMTNLILKRLMRKGYVKVKQLDWKKTQYLLTLKGSVEKARKSAVYAHFIWQQARKISEGIREAIGREYAAGARRAVVVAWPETSALIRQAVAEKAAAFAGLELDYVDSFGRVPPGVSLVFTATIEPAPEGRGWRVVSLLEQVHLEFRFGS